MKKLMIAVAVAGVMFSVNGFAASNSASPVSFQEVGFQYSNDALFANASNSDGAHIRMEGTIPQRCVLNLQAEGQANSVNGDIRLTGMLDDSKNTILGLTSKPVAKLRAWCNYGKSMDVDMTATPFKMTRFGMAIGKERIDYTLQANQTDVFDTSNASDGLFGHTTGNFKVKWSGKHQENKIAEIPLSITTEGAALARAGNYRSTVYVKLQAKTCHAFCGF
ncbi:MULTISPECIES: hypothetical protein [Vibrio]|uniref:Uncharacterized protein n=1 Tax=Vibrio lentus TaxID=136468 RepID=A0A2N7KGU5_9VIBR|nr:MULTISPECIES: hypothetical protein [Vibrio]MCC4882801.1 hypothetical protein [Vibrio splendidus]PMM75118.1 hypothetical protein BCT49_23300 [Vibrio lentus]PTO69788.1 hypothetical protein CWN96_05370 [Vibrio splendidus]PTP31101.1 hypothetical protein CWN92_07545 [Vibrio splendidus]PTP73476.1 hypothetical protein CWO06_17965 [Vibrio splendidus]